MRGIFIDIGPAPSRARSKWPRYPTRHQRSPVPPVLIEAVMSEGDAERNGLYGDGLVNARRAVSAPYRARAAPGARIGAAAGRVTARAASTISSASST